MKFYCGIDLSARDCHVCVIDEQLKIVIEQKLRNELPGIIKLLQPYKAKLKIVVESTFNWYWLIDGLQAEGFEVVLAHTLGLYLITGAKVKTDRRDAYSLAKLLLVGAVPAAYIYPVETRPVRDLLRRRMHLVQVRAGEYGSLRRLLLRQGILSSKQQEIKTATEAELEQWFAHPLVRLHASQELRRIELYSQQIAELEKIILALAQTAPSYELLLQLPGVGQTIALTILYEVGAPDALRQRESFQFLLPGGARYRAIGQRQQTRARQQAGESLSESRVLASSRARGALLSKGAPLLRTTIETASGPWATDDLLQHHRPQTGPGRFPCPEGAN